MNFLFFSPPPPPLPCPCPSPVRLAAQDFLNEGREIRSPNLLIWSQTLCHCAIPPGKMISSQISHTPTHTKPKTTPPPPAQKNGNFEKQQKSKTANNTLQSLPAQPQAPQQQQPKEGQPGGIWVGVRCWFWHMLFYCLVGLTRHLWSSGYDVSLTR